MASLLVVGGRQRQGALGLGDWQAYDEARVVRVDTDTGQSELLWSYRSPPDCCAAEQPAMVFKAGTLTGDRIWLCTMTEVLVWNWRQRQLERRWTHPWFNDLHHVLPVADRGFLVANTGLDQVLRLSLEGDVVEEWSVAPTATWERFDRSVDYRLVPTTKPHESHVNYVFQVDGQVWATRFLNQDAVCLTDRRPALPLVRGGPHDGIETPSGVWFTTVNGWVAQCNSAAFSAESEPDRDSQIRWCQLQSPETSSAELGWCRGLHEVTAVEAWVGFSRLRPTRFRSHVSWLKHGFKRVGLHGTRPTRIARYDLQRGECRQEIDLESVSLNAVFGIYQVD